MFENQLLADIRQPSTLVEDFSESLRCNPFTEILPRNELFVFLCAAFLHDIGHYFRFEYPPQIKHRSLTELNWGFIEPCLYQTYTSGVRRKRLPDYDVRLKLSKLVGLGDIPQPDSNAIQKLSGMIEDKILSETIDSVELIREIRGS
ncbi:hypothetical protein HQ586_08435 [Candidatus Bathyarchaeota archaeon]|nr:hypothetical protein [Candidatus Bathyarchaeota archaeon]